MNNKIIQIGNAKANAGEIVEGSIEVTKHAGGNDLLIPFTIINGKNDLLIEHYININELKEDWEAYLTSLSFHGKLTQTNDSISGKIWRNICENKLVIDDNKTTLTNKTNEITTLIKLLMQMRSKPIGLIKLKLLESLLVQVLQIK